MNISNELPIIFIEPVVLVPGFIMKIRLQVEKNSNLLNYLQTNIDSKSIHIGVIPKSDFKKAGKIIGTVGLVQSIIKVNSVPEDFVLVTEGICRFELNETISEDPLQISKVTIIENFKILQGDEGVIDELNDEFGEMVKYFLTYSEPGMILNISVRKSLKGCLSVLPLNQIADYCLKTFVRFTPDEAYTFLRATNLLDQSILIKNWLFREVLKENSYSTSVETDLVPVAPTVFEYII